MQVFVFQRVIAMRISFAHVASLTNASPALFGSLEIMYTSFWATVTSNGSPYATGPLSNLSVLSVCNDRVLWPDGWMDQDATWYEGRPRPWRHCVRWGPSSPTERAQQPHPTFRPNLLRHGRSSQQLLSSCYEVLVSSSSIHYQMVGCFVDNRPPSCPVFN